jgi:hypothetical protein
MTYSPILIPVVVLIAWSLVICMWMAATRLPAMKQAGIDATKLIGGRGQDLEGVVPDKVMWVSHNYNHLMEQPTLFYALSISLAIAGLGNGINLWLAWIYVGLRVVHSLVQATTNRVKYRGPLFGISSLVLISLTVSGLVGLIG